jgi:hypothetical protein
MRCAQHSLNRWELTRFWRCHKSLEGVQKPQAPTCACRNFRNLAQPPLA